MQHAGIYVKVMPGDHTHTEAFELRPDLLVEWSAIEIGNDGLDLKDKRGNWAVSLTRLSLYLTDDEESYQQVYLWDGDKWISEDDPNIYLKKRGDAKDIKGPMYFDAR